MTFDRLATREYRYSPLTRAARNMLRKVNRAIDEFDLLAGSDRVCVAVSGGKDSLSLLHLLLEHRRFYNLGYEISAAHVVSDFSPDAEQTKLYIDNLCRSFGVPCSFLTVSVTSDRDGNPADPTCFWCSWKRREALFAHCSREGWTKLALAHHYDDVAETTLLNLIFHGHMETMLPSRVFFDGAFTLIRPLFYVRERDLARYATLAKFETASCVCPNADQSMRRRMKDLVRELVKESPLLHPNLWHAARLWWEAYGDRPLHRKERSQETEDGRQESKVEREKSKTENR